MKRGGVNGAASASAWQHLRHRRIAKSLIENVGKRSRLPAKIERSIAAPCIGRDASRRRRRHRHRGGGSILLAAGGGAASSSTDAATAGWTNATYRGVSFILLLSRCVTLPYGAPWRRSSPVLPQMFLQNQTAKTRIVAKSPP